MIASIKVDRRAHKLNTCNEHQTFKIYGLVNKLCGSGLHLMMLQSLEPLKTCLLSEEITTQVTLN